MITYFTLLLPFCMLIIIFFYFWSLSVVSLLSAFPSFFPFASLCRVTLAHIPYETSREICCRCFFFLLNFQRDSFFSCNPISFAVECGIWVTGCFKTSQLLWIWRWRGEMETGDWWEVFYFYPQKFWSMAQLVDDFYYFKTVGRTKIDPLSLERKISTTIVMIL